jgi:hypothetical protein
MTPSGESKETFSVTAYNPNTLASLDYKAFS